MTHLQSSSNNDELGNILSNLRKKKIPFRIKISKGIVVDLLTQDKKLLDFAKVNNPKLK